MRLPGYELNRVLSLSACVALACGSVVLLVTDHVAIAGTLDLIGAALFWVWAVRIVREMKVSQKRLNELMRDFERTWPPTVRPPESDD